MQTDARVTLPSQPISTSVEAVTHPLPLWTRVSEFVLKKLLGVADDASLSIEARERQQWDKQW